MTLSEDEIKVLLGLMDQLNFKLRDSVVLIPIYQKLNALLEEPNLKPSEKATTTSDEAINLEPIPES